MKRLIQQHFVRFALNQKREFEIGALKKSNCLSVASFRFLAPIKNSSALI